MARARQEHEQRFGPLRQQQAPGAPPPFNQTQWTAIGPKLISTTPDICPTCGPQPGTTPASGRIRAIAIDPTNANTIYIGAASGGVWKTDDGGTTWRALTDTQCSLAMGAIAIDPGNNKVIYAGTGEGPTIGSSYLSGCGLLKSTDGGVTWTQMGASVFDPPNQEGARIWKIAITGNTVMVASTFGVFRSTDGGSTFTPMPVLGGIGSPVTDLVIDPRNDMIMYAAIGNTFGSNANGFYRSVDGGATWFRFGYPPDPAFSFPTDNVGRIALAVAPSAPRTLYAAVARPIRTGDPLSGTLRGVFKSFNGGDAWTPRPATGALCAINDQQGPGGQCW